jgi:hypothetical protein
VVWFDENDVPYVDGWWSGQISAPQVSLQNGDREAFTVVMEVAGVEMVA